METRGISNINFVAGLDTLTTEKHLNDGEHPGNPSFEQPRQQVSICGLPPWSHGKLAVVSLALLAAALLIADISLGVHYSKLKGTYLTLDDTKHIANELIELQDTYKNAIETMNGYKKQLESEMSRQTPINWEFEHQTKRSKDYEVQLDKMTKEVAALKNHLPMIHSGCKHCPAGWILMNSVCYYFHFSTRDGFKSWQKARDFCSMHGGDLAIIDSKDKQNSTVTYLSNKRAIGGFWIGLKDQREEGTWIWVDGRLQVEGYWMDGEPNNIVNGIEDCVEVYPKENFFKAWNDDRCDTPKKWICEKAPTYTD